MANPENFRVGQAIAYEGSGEEWDAHYNKITAINGNVLSLQRPAAGASAGTVVYQGHSMITAFNESNIAIEDLKIVGWTDGAEAAWGMGGFVRGAIHTWNVTGITVQDVEVDHWVADGISIQGGRNATIDRSVSHDNRGHGFHPGTGLTNAEWTNLEGYGNKNDGLYYCWHNNNVNVRNSYFHDNGRHGIGGLGNPGDRNNTIEYNTLENNAEAGIQINGGLDANNTIQYNIIRNNSTASAGAYAGVHFDSMEAARYITIRNNTFESTTSTQRVAIQETSNSNYNTIEGNTFSGHITDVIVYGANTVVNEPGDNVIYN